MIKIIIYKICKNNNIIKIYIVVNKDQLLLIFYLAIHTQPADIIKILVILRMV